MKRLVLWGIAQEEEGHAGAWRALAFQIPTYIIGLDSLCGSGGQFFFFLLLSSVKSITRIPYSVLPNLCCYCLCGSCCQNLGVIAKPSGEAE